MKDTLGTLFAFGILCLGFIGWVLNIISLIKSNESTGMMIARAAGVLMAPLGSILGFI